MYLYIIGVAATGVVVGMFVGLSDSPVVGALLPLLFTLIAGGSGLYVVFSGDSGKARLLGTSLVAFTFAVAISAVSAAHYRVFGHVFWATDDKPWIVDDVPNGLPTQAQIDLFEIYLAFQILGIPEEESNIFIKRLKSEVPNFPGELEAATNQLYMTVTKLLDDRKENNSTPKLTSFILTDTRERASYLSALLKSKVVIPTNLITMLTDPTCTSPINPPDESFPDSLRADLDAFYVACARLAHIARSHPSSILADLHNRIEKINKNWPDGRLIPEKQLLHFENR